MDHLFDANLLSLCVSVTDFYIVLNKLKALRFLAGKLPFPFFSLWVKFYAA